MTVKLIYLPSGPAGAKMGADDFLAAGGTVDDLLALATEELRPPPKDTDEGGMPYLASDAGLFWRKPTRDGITLTPLTNFTARIVGDVAEDDGAEVRRAYQIEGAVKGRAPRTFTVPAAQFATMNWPTEHLGAPAILAP